MNIVFEVSGCLSNSHWVTSGPTGALFIGLLESVLLPLVEHSLDLWPLLLGQHSLALDGLVLGVTHLWGLFSRFLLGNGIWLVDDHNVAESDLGLELGRLVRKHSSRACPVCLTNTAELLSCVASHVHRIGFAECSVAGMLIMVGFLFSLIQSDFVHS